MKAVILAVSLLLPLSFSVASAQVNKDCGVQCNRRGPFSRLDGQRIGDIS
jgi:hypothetical protein